MVPRLRDVCFMKLISRLRLGVRRLFAALDLRVNRRYRLGAD
jgi:hypothetical protein